MEIIIAVAILAGLGVLLGFGLAVAAKVLYVKPDTRVEDISAILPNANFGACGYPGCAEAIVSQTDESLNLCKPGLKSGVPEKIRHYLDEHPNEDGTVNPIKLK